MVVVVSERRQHFITQQHSFTCTISLDMQKTDAFFLVMRISIPEKANGLPRPIQMYVDKLKDHLPLSPQFFYYICTFVWNKYLIQNKRDFSMLIMNNSGKLTLPLQSHCLHLFFKTHSVFLLLLLQRAKKMIYVKH